ncbi:MAG: NUDIX hydrolase [Anaerolineae bacterium]
MPAYIFCPYCGQLLADAHIEGHVRPVCAQGHVIYRHSKVAVGALILDRAGRVLLTQRAGEPFAGWWDVPGGFLEAGEHPADGLRREMREELGIEVEIVHFLGHFMDAYQGEDVLNIVYIARADVSRAVPHDDVTAFGWFDPAAPPQNLAFACNAEALKALAREVAALTPEELAARYG